MTRDEMIERITGIGSGETVEEIRASLGELQQELSNDYDSFTQMQTVNNQLSEDNEKLRSANMRLFTQLGVKDKADEPTIGDDKPKEKRKFNDLFNEKGGLK